MCSVPAIAQSTSTPAPSRFAVDENGVNAADGKQYLVSKEVSVGAGEGELAYFMGRGYQTGGSPFDLKVIAGSVYSVGIFGADGPKSETFSKSGATYTSTLGDGSSLIYSGSAYILTLADGTVYTYGFDQPQTGENGIVVARLTQIDQPDHTRLNVTWNYTGYCSNNLDGCSGGTTIVADRIQSVTNSFGYQLHYDYGRNTDPITANQGYAWQRLKSITAFNMGVDACAPDATTCTFSQTWPKASYSTVVDAGGTATTTVTDVLSRVQTYVTGSDASGIYSTVTRPGSSSPNETVHFNSAYRVASVTRDGLTWSYSWTLSGTTMTQTRTNPDSSTRTIVSDTNVGLPTAITDELGHVTRYVYDSSGRLAYAVTPEGTMTGSTPSAGYTQFSYDTRGNITQTKVVSKTAGTPPNIVTSAAYPSGCTNVLTCNQPTSTTDANGNVTDYTYDASTGKVLTVTLPAPTTGATRPKTSYGYTSYQAFYKNSAGSIVASGTPMTELTSVSTCQTAATCAGTGDEVKTTISYGPQTSGTANNLLPVTVTKGAGDGSLSATNTIVYDNVGNLFSVDGPLSGTADTTRYRYDAARQLIGMVGPDPDGAGALKNRAQRLSYTPDGLVTKVEVGTVASQSDTDWAGMSVLQTRDTSYDANDRKVADALSAGGATYQVTQYSYDADGRLQCTAQRMNASAWGSLPSDACTLQTTGSYGPDRIVKATYDAAGHQIKAISAYGTGDASDDATTTYNPDGTIATLTDANGNVTSYSYDGFDRLVKTAYPSPTTTGASSTTDYEALVYDAAGNVTSRHLRGYAADSTQHIDYTYDHLDRVTTKDLPGSELDVTYGYDLLNRLTSAATTAQTLTFGYDALSRMTSQGGPLGTMAMQYDAAGERTRLTWPDAFYVAYDYDSAGNLMHVRENGAASGIGVLATLSYDDLGRRTKLTRGNGTSTTYTPDAVSRLASLAHDLAGTTSDVTTTFGYNPASQIASLTRSSTAYAASFTNAAKGYTINGLNQATTSGTDMIGYDVRGNITSAGTDSYTYSSENLLLTGPSSASMTYDPLLRLYQESGVSSLARLQYDGLDMVGEYDTYGALQKRYVFGGGGDDPIVEYDKSGGTYTRAWLYADERGSVVARADDSGAVTAINSYDEYGLPGASNAGRFQYTGQQWIPELGIYYYKARMYSSRLGRFLQTDPIGYADGINWYNYVGGDPVNFTDPSGLQVDDKHYKSQQDDQPPTQFGQEVVVVANPLPSSALGVSIAAATVGRGLADHGAGDAAPQNDIVVTGRRPHHHYEFTERVSPIGCNPGPGAINDLAARFAVPGRSPSNPVQNGEISDASVGPFKGRIVTYVNGATTVNVTLPGHIFYYGSVTRTTLVSGDGTIYVRTIGDGYNSSEAIADLNQTAGPIIFYNLDNEEARYIDYGNVCR